MRISVTGDKGFSLVEVIVALTIIGSCYIVIAKGIVENMKLNRRIEEYSNYLLTARKYFVDFPGIEHKNVKTTMENIEKDLTLYKIEFYDEKENRIIEFKEYILEDKK